ncbi:hypothetical protein F5146DRAFT_1008171 [Armillaria mellea]|nr:hypothetical protein F5146DRAFT_1008171 [Armillaria mellea]
MSRLFTPATIQAGLIFDAASHLGNAGDVQAAFLDGKTGSLLCTYLESKGFSLLSDLHLTHSSCPVEYGAFIPPSGIRMTPGTCAEMRDRARTLTNQVRSKSTNGPPSNMAQTKISGDRDTPPSLVVPTYNSSSRAVIAVSQSLDNTCGREHSSNCKYDLLSPPREFKINVRCWPFGPKICSRNDENSRILVLKTLFSGFQVLPSKTGVQNFRSLGYGFDVFWSNNEYTDSLKDSRISVAYTTLFVFTNLAKLTPRMLRLFDFMSYYSRIKPYSIPNLANAFRKSYDGTLIDVFSILGSAPRVSTCGTFDIIWGFGLYSSPNTARFPFKTRNEPSVLRWQDSNTHYTLTLRDNTHQNAMSSTYLLSETQNLVARRIRIGFQSLKIDVIGIAADFQCGDLSFYKEIKMDVSRRQVFILLQLLGSRTSNLEPRTPLLSKFGLDIFDPE